MAENFPDLKKGTTIQEQEAHKVPNKMNPNRTTPRHTVTKWQRSKNSEGSKRKTVLYKGVPIRLSADFSAETWHARGSINSMIYSKS